MTRYLLMCQNCGTKHYTDGSDTSNLVEVKSAPLPARANGKDSSSFSAIPKKYKCFNCGFVFKISRVAGSTPEVKETKERVREEAPPPEDPDEYIKKWAAESLKSVRNKTRPPT